LEFDEKTLFKKIINPKTKTVEKKNKFLWYINRCAKNSGSLYVNNLQIVCDEFEDVFCRKTP
jgi:hypothetical protein